MGTFCYKALGAMTKFRTPRIGSNVVHRLELPLNNRMRARRSAMRRRRGLGYEGSGDGESVNGSANRNGDGAANGHGSNGNAPERPVVAVPAVLPSRDVAPPVVPRPVGLKDSQARHQIQLLERRLAKMARLLEQKDQEFSSRPAAAEDDGVASIYREVQGLGGRTKEAKTKRAFMSVIFEANLKLRESVTSASSDAE